MNIGSLNRQVVIQRLDPAAGVDEFRQPVAAWVQVAKPWASIRYAGGLETIRGGAETSVTKASIRIRFRTDIDSAMRVLHGGVTYAIKAVLPDQVRREYIDLVCEVPGVVV